MWAGTDRRDAGELGRYYDKGRNMFRRSGVKEGRKMSEDENYSIEKDVSDIIDDITAKRIKEMQHGEGMLTGGNRQYQSVLQRLAQSVKQDAEYRQSLLLASFLGPEEADRAVAAIAECRRYGVPITVLVDKIVARCAVRGATGGRIQSIIEALTHQQITANTTKDYQKMQQQQKGKNSPLGNA